MDKYIEPYIKENNVLQLSLFYFGKGRPEKTNIAWKDESGDYELGCVCKYGVPGSFDQDVYTGVMRIWVKNGMDTNGMHVSYSDIAKELGLTPPRSWTTHIKKAMERLAQARYEFKQCFLKAGENGVERVNTHFSLFDSVALFEYNKGKSKKKGKSFVVFPKEICNNLESKYYQYLDMVWYRALPEGLPRRLYEYLEKRRYHKVNGVFFISENLLCRWLPIKDKHTTNRRKRLSRISQSLIDAGYLKDYFFDKSKKMCRFTYAESKSPEKKESANKKLSNKENVSKKESVPKCLPYLTELDRLISLIRLKRVPKSIKNILAKHLKENGVAYVERNILYSNEKAKTSYSNYLSTCLENDYAEAWQEEKNQRQETLFDLHEELKKKHEEEEEKKKREGELEKLRAKFLEKAEKLGVIFKRMALESAEREVEDSPSKQFAIKPAYSNRILDIVNEMGGGYPKEILTMDIMKKLWSQKIVAK